MSFYSTRKGPVLMPSNRYNRVTTEEGRDPKFTYTPQQFILSYGETALYISVMGDPVTGVAPLEYVKIFFGEWG